MLDTVLKIADIIIKTVSMTVKIINIWNNTKDKHQKSNRHVQGQVAFLISN